MSTARRAIGAASATVLAGWAVYTGVLASGYLLSRVPKHRAESAWLVFVALAALAVAISGFRRVHGAPVAAAESPEGRADAEGQGVQDGHHGVQDGGRGPGSRSSGDGRAVRGAGWAPGGLLGAAGAAALAVGLYAGTVSLGLLSDDFVLAARAASREFTDASWFFRPVPLALWWAVLGLGGGAAGLHLVNVGLHAANTLLVAILARRLSLSHGGSLVAAALFATFPAAVEAVAWASGVQDVLLTTCALVYVLAFTVERRGTAFTLGVAAFLLALGTKETAVVLPALGLVAWLRQPGARWQWPLAGGGFAAAAGYAAARLWLFPLDQGFMVTPDRYMAKELLSRLFSSLALPYTSGELHALPSLSLALTWLFVVLVLAAAWRASRHQGLAAVMARTGTWAVASVLPVYSMFFVSGDLQGSRYLYLASCGWALLVSAMLVDPQRRLARMAALAAAAALVVVSAAGVRWHLSDWQDAARLRERVLEAAAGTMRTTDCPTVRFGSLPDSVGGAYVFRNGFLEALAARAPFAARAEMAGEVHGPCTVRWDGRAFR